VLRILFPTTALAYPALESAPGVATATLGAANASSVDVVQVVTYDIANFGNQWPDVYRYWLSLLGIVFPQLESME
jgi:hypothetical protein